MMTKNCTQKNSTVFLCVCLLSIATTAFSEESKWLFNSFYGQPVHISYVAKEEIYAFTSGDVTQRVPPCETKGMRICIRSDHLDLSIPEKVPQIGETWGGGGVTFSLIRVIEDLGFLGVRLENVQVIAVSKDLEITLGIPGIRKSWLFYSYQDGLIAFLEETDRGSGPILIASKLPSLGATNVRSQ